MKRYSLWLVLFFLIHSATSGLYAGRYQLDGLNYTSGVYTTVTGAGTLVADATGLYATGANIELTFSGLILKYGSTWSKLSLNISSTGGSVDVAVRDSSGYMVILQAGVTTNATFDLTAVSSQIAQSRSLQLIFTITPNVKITNILLDYSGNSVFVYPSPYRANQGINLKISYDLAWDAKVSLVIYDNAGRVVKKILNESLQTARNSRFTQVETWNGFNDSGVPVASGIYTVLIKVRFVDVAATESGYTSSFRFLVLR